MSELATPRLALPLLAAGQAQKEMYHNEALALIDLVLCGAAVATDVEVPPEAPELGASWILGDAPEAEWAGYARHLAGWTEGGWRFVAPREGMRIWLSETAGFALFTEGEWQAGRAHGRLLVDGQQIIGPRGAAITEPTGGTVVDAEARAAILAMLEVMRVHGLIETV